MEQPKEEEVVVEVALQGRRPRHQSNTTTFSTSTETISSGISGIKSATVECSPSEMNSTDQEIGKILSTIINHEGENVKGEEEVIELEFQKSGLDTHPKPNDQLGCLSCFSFFIPTGICFTLSRIFGCGRKENMVIDQDEKPQKVAPLFTKPQNIIEEIMDVEFKICKVEVEQGLLPSQSMDCSAVVQISFAEEESDEKILEVAALFTKPQIEEKMDVEFNMCAEEVQQGVFPSPSMSCSACPDAKLDCEMFQSPVWRF